MRMTSVSQFIPWYETNLSELDTAIYNYVCYGSEDNGQRANFLFSFDIPDKYIKCNSKYLYRHEKLNTKQLTFLESKPIIIHPKRKLLAFTLKGTKILDLEANVIYKKEVNKLDLFLNIPEWFNGIKSKLIIPDINKGYSIYFRSKDKLEKMINNEQEILVINTTYSSTINYSDIIE